MYFMRRNKGWLLLLGAGVFVFWQWDAIANVAHGISNNITYHVRRATGGLTNMLGGSDDDPHQRPRRHETGGDWRIGPNDDSRGQGDGWRQRGGTYPQWQSRGCDDGPRGRWQGTDRRDHRHLSQWGDR